jgi:hypothetical protein
MRKKMLFSTILVCQLVLVWGQNEQDWTDTLSHQIILSELELNEVDELLELTDTLIAQKLLDNESFIIISKFILDNRLQKGYNLILDNALSYKRVSTRFAAINIGPISVIYDYILRNLELESTVSLISYILFSDYLEQDLSKEELELVTTIIKMDGLNLYSRIDLASNKNKNIDKIGHLLSN